MNWSKIKKRKFGLEVHHNHRQKEGKPKTKKLAELEKALDQHARTMTAEEIEMADGMVFMRRSDCWDMID
jgi:hypothetical protein